MAKFRLETDKHWWVFDTESEALQSVPEFLDIKDNPFWTITEIEWDDLTKEIQKEFDKDLQ